jgi:uncharacterized protein (TIGR02271 family)
LTEDSRTPQTIPVFDERLHLGKVERDLDAVQIKTSLHERTEYAQVELLHSDVVIERIAVNRVVDAVPPVRREDGTVVIPVVEEIMVVEKRLLLKEEIHVRQEERVEHVREPVVLRSEEAEVIRKPPYPSRSQQQAPNAESKEKS